MKFLSYGEERIIASVIDGEPEAFKELVTRYENLVFTICLRMLKNREEAEDIAQEVFLQAYQSLSDYKQSSTFSTWIYRIAVNKCLDIRRKIERRSAIAPVVPIHEDQPILSREETPEEIVMKKEQKAAIDALVSHLSPKYRDVILLYHYHRLSYKEIAEALSIAVKTVETRMARAKRQLCDAIQQRGGYI